MKWYFLPLSLYKQIPGEFKEKSTAIKFIYILLPRLAPKAAPTSLEVNKS